MRDNRLQYLLKEYQAAPSIYHVTGYWNAYQDKIASIIETMDWNQLRSGKYPALATFGFGDTIYTYHTNMPYLKKIFLKQLNRYILNKHFFLPYQLCLSDIQEMAFHHCELMCEITNSKSIKNINISNFGNPQGVFSVDNKQYTIQFLAYYLRYCFSNKHIHYSGSEIIVELGSGSGYQIEIFKKLYPNITILCFDLPAQIFLCEEYLKQAIPDSELVGTDETIHWRDLSKLKSGAVHFLGNWQMPLLRDLQFDVFWNAASFGEMEPNVVKNYIDCVNDNATWIYLLQARHGKETSGKSHVQSPTSLIDYISLLKNYNLEEELDAWQAHRRLSQSGGYFEGIWKKH